MSNFWRAYTGFDGAVVGIDRFGESAPAAQVAEALGLTAQSRGGARTLRWRPRVEARHSNQ